MECFSYLTSTIESQLQGFMNNTKKINEQMFYELNALNNYLALNHQ